MAKIIWTLESSSSLKEIHDFIAIENPKSAIKVVVGIIEKVELLLEYPNIGCVYSKKMNFDIRIFLYGHYRIAYIIDDQSIVILGVFHGAMDIDRYLN